MSRAEPWEAFVGAVAKETALVQDLVRVTVEMGHPLSRLDVPEVERTTAVQEAVLTELGEAARTRTEAIERCVPGVGDSASRLGFQMVIVSAPERFSSELRRLRDQLLLLRDEFTLVRARNRLLMEQTLEFTAHFGRSLVTEVAEPPSYDASGARSASAVRGELFSGAL